MELLDKEPNQLPPTTDGIIDEPLIKIEVPMIPLNVLTSKGTKKRKPNADGSQIPISKEITVSPRDVLIIIDSLKRQIAANRCVYIKEKVEENRKNLAGITHNICKLSSERKNSVIYDSDKSLILLSKRQRDALDMQNSKGMNTAEKNENCYGEDLHPPSAVLLGSSIAVKNAIQPLILAETKRLPPYTTWIFLHRNQRMTEDQTVVGRRRIYYDQNGGEALICSDSEEDMAVEEEDNKEFTESEDYILRMTAEKVGMSDMTVDLLAQCLSRKPCEVKARCKAFAHGDINGEDMPKSMDLFFDKDLDAALDSFDNLFCRRCLVFDCRLHGCSQDLVFPVERQHSWNIDEENSSCGPYCYKSTLKSEPLASMMLLMDNVVDKKTKYCTIECASSNAKLISRGSKLEVGNEGGSSPLHHIPTNSKSVYKNVGRKKKNKQFMGRVITCSRKTQNKMATYSSSAVIYGDALTNNITVESILHKASENAHPLQKRKRSPASEMLGRKELMTEGGCETFQGQVSCEPECTKFLTIGDEMLEEEHVAENVCLQEATEAVKLSWGAMEKSLFEKGLEIFGRSSCLIARNLLTGMKTCLEVFQYMNSYDNKRDEANDAANILEFHSNINCSYIVGNEMTRKSGFLRRRGKVRRLKYTWKSTGYHSIRKRISERKDQPCRQFNPCGCQSACGKLCSCLLNGTCCEKYCGCGKNCKNRFRGCHCAKSQCRSRQCPCFAAGRECDPDVCRNCWISCGDGTFGRPSQRGDNYECCNMKLLLKQQQRVLLGRSDVSGWGAFLKNNVGKHEYLGEYTGELISHREADKRGKIYDRENSSFLFNLNDQFVLDAFRKGDKLKFANHSPDPNCYAKVMMVAGDHRVGIFAKERINAGEELFYDYRYDADRAPAWARKPDVCGGKKDDSHFSAPIGRPKKLA